MLTKGRVAACRPGWRLRDHSWNGVERSGFRGKTTGTVGFPDHVLLATRLLAWLTVPTPIDCLRTGD